jgi:hypothetical protein
MAFLLVLLLVLVLKSHFFFPPSNRSAFKELSLLHKNDFQFIPGPADSFGSKGR